MKTTEVSINLHSNQARVLAARRESGFRFRVCVSGRRFGKTHLALSELALEAMSTPNMLLWYVSPSYRQSKMIAWTMLKNMIPRDLIRKVNESELAIRLHNGSIIELKGAENEDNLRGQGLDGLVIDEFAAIHNNWSVWYEVLRPALSDKKGWCLFIGTPKGKDAFYELWLRGQRDEAEWASFKFRTVDNKAIDLTDEVASAKKEMPDRYFKQEYLADFQSFQGLIWPEFGDTHIIKPFTIPPDWPLIGSIDTASSGTTAVLWCAVGENDTLYFYREFYKENVRPSEVCKELREYSDFKNVHWIIDPASKAKTQASKQGGFFSLYDEYAEHGVRAVNAEKDVAAGIQRVGEYFRQNKIKVFTSLDRTIWEYERYHYAEARETNRGEISGVPYKKHDHQCDNTKYLIMSRPHKGIDSKERHVPKYSVKWWMDKDESDAKDWRNKYRKSDGFGTG